MKKIAFQLEFLNIVVFVMAISLIAFNACKQQLDFEAPTFPQNLTAVPVSSSQIDISWSQSSDNEGVTGYYIYRDGEKITSIAQTSYSDSDLTASTPYTYTVSAYDEAGNKSGQSNPAYATTKDESTDTEPPSVPQNLTAIAVSSSQINLNWSASTDNVGITGYRIYRNGNSTPIATITQTTYSDSNLSASTEYTYTTLAYDAAGNESVQSNPVTETTDASFDDQKPTIPQNLTTTAVSSSQINLTWSASTDNVGVTGYRLYRNGNSTPIATINKTTYSDMGLSGSTEYSYTVSAYDAAGNESVQSDSRSAITTATPDTEPPSIPQNLMATAVSSSQINLSWSASTDNTGVTGYRIYRNGNSTPIATINKTTYSDTGLSALTTYSYRISAYDAAANESGLSDSKSATTSAIPDTEPPSVPQNLTAIAVSSSQINLSWSASTDNVGVTGYRLYRNGNSTPIATINKTTYSDTGLSALTTYSYTVSAYDAAGNGSNLSDPVTGTTPDEISGSQMIIDHNSTDIEAIPEEYIEAAKANLHIAYQQTSHGCQILTGMETILTYYGALYQFSDNGSSGLHFDTQVNGRPISEIAQDLTYDAIQGSGYTLWADATRTYLNNANNYNINVVMWAWCNITGHNITTYINNMEQLISEYGVGGSNSRAAAHPVEFIFMTGHSTADGESGAAATAAAQIRNHCIANNRWLIDYYDLECYDPDGNYFGDNYVGDNLRYSTDGGSTWTGNWAVDYLSAHPTSDLYNLAMGGICAYCCHSDADDGHKESKLNCILKGRAAWWLFARLAGWNGN